MGRRLLLVAALAACAVGAPASAGATIVSGTEYFEEDSRAVAVRGDASGNHVRVDLTAEGVAVRDTRSPVTARGHCKRRSDHLAFCPAATLDLVKVETGRGADVVVVRGERSELQYLQLRGGRGDDALTTQASAADISGGTGDDALTGGGGDDLIVGGPDEDRLHGGPGDDSLAGDQPYPRARAAHDRLHGGAGRDSASWASHEDPVTIDLRRGVGGEAGERDRLRSIEDAVGGARDDVLIGDDGANSLLGGDGDDVILGLGGNDRLDPGNYDDRPRTRDRLGCGAGARDRVSEPRLDPLGRDCELLALVRYGRSVASRLVRAHPRRLDATHVQVQSACFVRAGDCTRRVTLVHRGEVLGRSRERRLGEDPWLTVALTRPLPSRGVVAIQVHGDDPDPRSDAGGRLPFSFEYRVRR
jgi:hypothetical protein